MTPSLTVPARYRPAAQALIAFALVILPTACGSAAPTVSPAEPAAPTTTASAPPGVVGLAAAVNGTSIEVQNRSGQVTVEYTANTSITDQAAATIADVKVGDCVTAAGTPADGAAGLTARTLAVSTPVNGSCAANRPGGGPDRPGGSGGSGGSASRGPRPRPSGSPDPSASARATAFGTVTAVSGGTVTISGILRTPGPRTTTPPTMPPPAGPVSITTNSATRILRDVPATPAAIKVGVCVAAFGPSNDIGTITATTISVFQPGTTGTPGTPGSPGSPGTSGTPGTPGTSDTPGTPGTPVASGAPGAPGAAGTPGGNGCTRGFGAGGNNG